VTALVTGEINRADGLTDVVIGIVGPDGPHALVFESPDGALRGEPEAYNIPRKLDRYIRWNSVVIKKTGGNDGRTTEELQ
jgi:hypothetical protein